MLLFLKKTMSSDAPISLVVHTEPAKKSRSKPKKAAVDAAPEAIVSATMDENAVSPTPVPVPVVVDDADNSKKKGRKPRGGKLILKQTESSSALQTIPNIILHLKCSNRDLHEYNAKMSKLVKNPLEYNPDVPPQISTYNEHAQQFSEFDQKPPDSNLSLAYQEPVVQVSSQQSFVCPDCNVTMLPYANESTENEDHPNENMNMK